VADWPPQGWPPPVDPMLMGAPVPMAPPAPTLDVWPPPEYAELGALLPPAPAPMPPDPVMAANEQLLAQPVAPPAEDAPWPPAEWAPPAPEPAPAPQAPPQQAQRQAPPPGYGGQVQQTGGLMEDSLLREGEYEAAAADKRAEGMAQQARVARDYEAQAEQRAMERKADLDQRWQALQAERQQIANTKIEPQRLYADMDTGSRLAWGIAAGIAGALGTINGSGRNLVVEHINRQIDLDIDAQKSNLANRRGALGDGMSLYQQLVVKYGDEEQAAGMLRAAAYDRIAKEFEAEAAQYANPISKENALQAALIYRQQSDASVQDTAVKAEQRAFENRMQERQVGIQAYNAKTGRMNVEADTDVAKARAAAELAKLDAAERAKVVKGPDGLPIVDPMSGAPLRIEDEAERKDASKKMRAYANYRTALADYLGDVEKVGVVRSGWAQSDDATRLQAKRANLFNAWRGMVGAGTIDQGSLDAFSKVVPEPNGWVTGYDPVAGVRTTLELTDKAMDSDMRSYGYGGNWSADWQAQVPQKVGDTKARGNRQGWKYESLEEGPAPRRDGIPFTPAPAQFADPYGDD
jgi:hypothetical protein